jgi:hypothetical protein
MITPFNETPFDTATLKARPRSMGANGRQYGRRHFPSVAHVKSGTSKKQQILCLGRVKINHKLQGVPALKKLNNASATADFHWLQSPHSKKWLGN